MKLFPITPAQASFLEIEIVGRYLDDEDTEEARVAANIAEHLERSRGTAMAVGEFHRDALARMLLELINDMDDEIERAKKGDSDALGRLGGIDTVKQARGLWASGFALWKKVRT